MDVDASMLKFSLVLHFSPSLSPSLSLSLAFSHLYTHAYICTLESAALNVGSRSQAGHLARNSAMDDSIGGS